MAVLTTLTVSTLSFAASEGDGFGNSYFGTNAGSSLSSGAIENTLIGVDSGMSLSTGRRNTFLGTKSGFSNSVGDNNTFIGAWSGYYNEGNRNTFLGAYSGYSNTAGSDNTFIGNESGYNLDNSMGNIFIGSLSGRNVNSGDYNVLIGHMAGYNNTNGSNNVFIGYKAGYNADSVSGSVFIGPFAGSNATRSNTLYIANNDTNLPLIYGEFDTGLVKINGTQKIYWNGDSTKGYRKVLQIISNNSNTDKASDVAISLVNERKNLEWIIRTHERSKGIVFSKIGTLGTEFKIKNTTNNYKNVELILGNGARCTSTGQWLNASSREYKENIKELDGKKALEAFRKLRPVTFNFKRDKDKELMVGFIAEEVPDLIATKDRKSLNALEIVALLTKVVQEQEKIINKQKEEIEKLKKDLANVKALQERVSKLETILISISSKEDIDKFLSMLKKK